VLQNPSFWKEGTKLEETLSIEGTLLMLDDKTPHVAVVVQAIRGGKPVATVLSDEGGEYQLTNLEPGRYQLRCQVLGGYVYYRATDRALRFTLYNSQVTESTTGEDAGDILHVAHGKPLKNIDFRFAPFKKGTWKTFTYLDGLADNHVSAIYRDPDGVMWFGTSYGVSRYDGKEFVNLTTKDGLAHNGVFTIHRDPDGVMWFGTYGGGVSRYDGREFVNFTTEDGLAHHMIMCIHQDPDGVMWFGGGLLRQGGVSRYDGKEFVNLTTEDGLAANNVHAIHRDPDGVMWFATWFGGVSRYDGKEFVNLTTEDGLAANSVHAMHRDTDGVMWFGTYRGGVSRYDGKEFVNFSTKDGLASDVILCIHQDPDGVMWFGASEWITEDGGLSRYDGRGFVNFTTKDGLANDRVRAIHRDPDGVMWFGTIGGGISRYDEKGFVNFTTKDGLAHRRVHAIHRGPDGVMWFGTDRGVSRYDGKEFVNLTTGDGLAGNIVQAIHRDPDGVMWFGTRSGVFRYDGKEFVNLTTKDGLAHNLIQCIYQDPDGVMWFGASNPTVEDGGLSRYDGKEFVNFTTEDGLLDNAVNAIHRDPDGVMWFGTLLGGVSRYDGKEFVNLTAQDGLAANNVHAIHRDPDGVMWFGTWSGGVSRYDAKGVTTGDFHHFVNFTTEDGLAHNRINAIHRDPDGVMWFATEGGVSAYDGTAWTSLDTRDGLAGNRVESILQDSDGFLWFGTEGGITRYRRSATPPKVHIVSVTTDQTYRDVSDIPAFTPGTRVTIEYNAIDFKTVPEKRQYRCRVVKIPPDPPLERGGNSDWRKPTKATFSDFIFDELGTYTFEVQAIDRDLNYSEPASVKLEVIPDPRNHRIIQLEEHIRQQELAELERVHQELEDARQIQQSLLPESPPEIEGFDMAGTSLPAKEVSGDFYNYLPLGDNVGIVLADVTGKSVKAAMVAAMTNGMLQAEVKGQRELWNSPKGILCELNIGLQPHLIRSMYTAMSLGIIRADEKRLLFSNAGMPYPIVKRGREVWELEVSGLPLGISDGAEYEELSADLEVGDFVVFHSDGVIEATDETGGMYQAERLLEVVQQAGSDLSAQGLVDWIVKDVAAFAGDVEPSDDITIVVLRYID
jgi:ligand-binding sensor domain-containing protein/serine phosphatase RsbU (regulator of sigma subunit)